MAGIQKADLQPANDAIPDRIALDETMIRIDGQQFWLYAAVDPEINEFLCIRLCTTNTTALTEQFLRELCEKHDVSDAVFLVDHAKHLAAALRNQVSDFSPSDMETGMLSNIYLKK